MEIVVVITIAGAHMWPYTWPNVQDWSPRMNFIMKGSQISTLQLKGWFKCKTSLQKYRNETQNSYWTCAWIIWYMFPVQREELKFIHLTPLLVVTMPYACWFLWRAYYIEDFKWRLHFQSRVAFWRIVLREVYFEGSILRLKGVEDLNLEHWLGPRIPIIQ